MSHNIVSLAPHHLDAVWQIEQHAHAFPWSESLIRQTPSKIAVNLALEVGQQVVGYCYGQLVAGEATLLNIAVAPECQGKGYGKILLDGFIDRLTELGAEEIWLEVRASNSRAYQLYESVGFNEINRRYGYYPTATGREDALIMTYLVL
ncbi:ribosomal protein S18-alanine N-acetyltransferase [Photobacterium sp. MCCC 1A19761]|uniref:ribosomal protein S18-alanine N-acetyltransferase n=1 Tax=Photobacterium sp. MCCC 1A19761 TaxID=3115000 RepID=UPI00307F6DBE